MTESKIEYDKMNEVEMYHWWYESLHSQIIEQIETNYGADVSIKILDVGCGTGGLLQKLKNKGYHNCSGFDVSTFAVEYCLNKNLDVFHANMEDILQVCEKESYHVVISCDNLYFIPENERNTIVKNFHRILINKGLLIMNLPSMKAFSGIHDISVGIEKRHHHSELPNLFYENFNQYSYLYWPQLLSPFIYLERKMQRFRIKKGTYEVQSDVKIPNPILNAILLLCTKLERKSKLPFRFASSLLVTARK